MRKTIWKVQLKITDGFQQVQLPADAELLTVQMQKGEPCMWFVVDPDALREVRTFVVYGTGQLMHDIEKKYVGTVQDGPYVWHFFELR